MWAKKNMLLFFSLVPTEVDEREFALENSCKSKNFREILDGRVERDLPEATCGVQHC